jgi:hypothetical protein
LLKSTYSPEKSADPKKDDSEVVAKLTELAEDLPTRGFDVYYNRIRTEGLVWNRKRVLRVYRGMKLGMRRRERVLKLTLQYAQYQLFTRTLFAKSTR